MDDEVYKKLSQIKHNYQKAKIEAETYNQKAEKYGENFNDIIKVQFGDLNVYERDGTFNLHDIQSEWLCCLASLVKVKYSVIFDSDYCFHYLYGFKRWCSHNSLFLWGSGINHYESGFPKFNNRVIELASNDSYREPFDMNLMKRLPQINQKELPILFDFTDRICSVISSQVKLFTPEVKDAKTKMSSFIRYGIREQEISLETLPVLFKILNEVKESIKLINIVKEKLLVDMCEANREYKLINKLRDTRLKMF